MTHEDEKHEQPAQPAEQKENLTPLDDFESIIAEKNEAIADLKDKLLRCLAETENVRKRATVDVKNASDYAVKNFALSVLEVADNLERALVSLPEDAPVSFKEGIAMTLDYLKKTMEKHGVVEAPGIGAAFNPDIHHVVGQAESELPEGAIVEVLQKGYFLKDRPLREAMVMVAKKKIS